MNFCFLSKVCLKIRHIWLNYWSQGWEVPARSRSHRKVKKYSKVKKIWQCWKSWALVLGEARLRQNNESNINWCINKQFILKYILNTYLFFHKYEPFTYLWFSKIHTFLLICQLWFLTILLWIHAAQGKSYQHVNWLKRMG